MMISPIGNLTRNYIVVLVLLALLAFGNFYVLRVNIKSEQTTAAIVNISGRQRMLVERSAMFAQQLVVESSSEARETLRSLAASIERSHNGLISGDKELGLPGDPPTNVHSIFFDPPIRLDKQVQDFLASVRALADAPDMALTFNSPHLKSIQKAAGVDLLDGLDILVREYQKVSEAKILRIGIIQAWLLALTVAFLALMGWFIFRPMVKRIREELENLASAENRTRTIVENMLDGLVTIDADGQIESFNRASERIFGFSISEVIGKDIDFLVPGAHVSGKRKEDLSAGDIRELIGHKKDGGRVPVEFAASAVTLGGRQIFVCNINDISERKRFERELLAKNVELENSSAFDRSVGGAMALFSSSYNRDNILSGTLSLLSENHPFPVSAIYIYDEWKGLLSCAASFGTDESLVKEFKPGEGIIGEAASELRTILIDSPGVDSPLKIETGLATVSPRAIAVSPIIFQEKLMGVLSIASTHEVTKREEQFIERLAGQLGVALNTLVQYSDLKGMTEELRVKGEEVERKNMELEQASKLKNEFLANMSHELRTPLNAIIGFSEVLKDGVLGALSEEQTEYTTDIFNSGHHLLSLVNDILDLAKIEAGKMTLEPEHIRVRDVLENSFSIIKEHALARHIKLELKVAEDAEYTEADPRKFKQVIYNLLSNAVKFSDDGGTVSVIARRSTLEGTDYFEMLVKDTGIGMPSEEVGRLFRPFEQLDGSISRKYEGTGLGLAMVKRLVTLHGGMVSVESSLGKGSVFTVRFPMKLDLDNVATEAEVTTIDEGAPKASKEPLVAEVAAPAPSISLETTASSDAPLALLVEDNDDSAELCRFELAREGFNVMRCHTAEAGLLEAARVRPDIIILDILLPGMNGWEFLEKAKTDDVVKHIPIVISSIIAEGNEKKGFSLGASLVMQKPLKRKELIEAIAEIGIVGPSVGEGATVLVVDDDKKAVEIVSRYLESAGVNPLKCYGGQQAIDMAKKEPPDLILLDIMMPEVTGFDVVSELKSDPDTAGIPIIVVTAKRVTKEEREKLNGDVVHILEKSSANGKGFIAEVRRALHGRKERKPLEAASKAFEVKEDTKKEEAGEKAATKANVKDDASSPERVKCNDAGVKVEASPKKNKEGGQKTILVADDTPADANLLRLHLEKEGYNVIVAESGLEALELMNESLPDLIVLDLLMPGFDGFSFLSEKAAVKSYADIPVVVVSGVGDGVSGSVLGVNAVLAKPLKRDDLLSVVSSVLRPARNGKAEILVIDDDQKAIDLISTYFNKDTFTVKSALNGVDGFKEAVESVPDLILLDLMMPEISGFEILGMLREKLATRDIPVIIVTAKSLTNDEREWLLEKASRVAEKGCFNKEGFLAEVQTLLSIT